MTWVIKLCEIAEGKRRERTVFALGDINAPIDITDLGMNLATGKALLSAVQAAVVGLQEAALAENARSVIRAEAGASLKDYRKRRIQTPYGVAVLRTPRLQFGRTVEPTTKWPANCRSTPEFDKIRSTLSGWMSYREAEKLLTELLPTEGFSHHTTLRNRTLVAGGSEAMLPTLSRGEAPASTVNLGLDCTFIRSHDRAKGRLLEVFFGHVEPDQGKSRVFASVGEGSPERSGRIRLNLELAGCTDATSVTTFTDGGSGLRELAKGGGITETPILDWHHIAQRIQHVRQAAEGLTSSVPDLPDVTAKIIAEVERMRWRLWNGKPKAVAQTLERIRPLIKTRRQPTKKRLSARPWNTLMGALYVLRKYTTGQEAWMVNYAKLHRQGGRVGTSQTESAANSLVNKRMNKSLQMRWSSVGAHCLLQVRAALINGDTPSLSLTA